MRAAGVRNQGGMTLVELMIAITLGILIMTALTTLFVDVSRANREMAKTNSQIESARFAMDIIAGDMVHGGYWGGFVPHFDDVTLSIVPDDIPDAVPAPCTAFASWDAAYVRNLLGIPVQFYNGVPAGCSGVVQFKRANTDVVLVRHAGTCAYNWHVADAEWKPGRYDSTGTWVDDANCEAYDDNQVYFQTSRCETEISAGDEVVISDDPSDFTLQTRACDGTLAPMYRLVQNLYYIRNCAVLSAGGNCTGTDTIPTLVRLPFDGTQTPPYGAAQPLVEGIENLQISVGIDRVSDDGTQIADGNPATLTDPFRAAVDWADEDNRDSPVNRGDGVPDWFLGSCGVGCDQEELMHVAAARVFVLARATEETPGYTDTKTYTVGTVAVDPNPDDGFKRHVFSTTVRFVNITSRRETP